MPWKTTKLAHIEQATTREIVDKCNFEIAWGVDGQYLVYSICQGDKLLFTCRENFQDGWGNDWEVRDLFRGYWYHRKRKKFQTLVLLDNSPFAFCYFHLVFCTKFPMPMSAHKCKGTLPTYTLEHKVEETILQALADRQLLESGDRWRYSKAI